MMSDAPQTTVSLCFENMMKGHLPPATSAGSKQRDAVSEQKQSRPIAPLPRPRPQGSGSSASVTKSTRQSSGGSDGTLQAQMSSGSNANRPVGQGSGGSGKRSLPEDAAPVRPPGKDGPGLHHLMHFPIVVAEVCFPSTNIKSGGQLVRVILHCMLAHKEATVKCGMLHGDVSSGNILIRPAVVRVNPTTDELGVLWLRLLSDWELAKPLQNDSTVGKAHQPRLMGTWCFMSVHRSAHPEVPVSIADELESFLHVLIYLAVRFLRTSSLHARLFAAYYFEGFAEDENHCSILKQMVVRSGSMAWNGEPVVFVANPPPADDGARAQPRTVGSPLDGVVAAYLAYCKARYAVSDYEYVSATTTATTPSPSSQSATDSDAATSVSDEERGRQTELAGDLEMGIPDFPDIDKLSTGHTPEEMWRAKPPESVYKRAAKLETHDAILDLLAKGIRKHGGTSSQDASRSNRSPPRGGSLQMRTTPPLVLEGEGLPESAHAAA